MRVWLCGVAAIVTGCAGMQPIKLHTPGPPPPRAELVRGLGGLHGVQFEDSTAGRVQAEVLMESFCGGPAAVVQEGELAQVSGAHVLVGSVLVPITARPSAKRWNFVREARFRCSPIEL